MMSETTSFALRLPPELKSAAKALINTNFYDPSVTGKGSIKGKGPVTGVSPRSINDAIIYLMKKGMLQTLEHLEAQITKEEAELEIWEPIVAFFLQNPDASQANPGTFAKGSPARVYLTGIENKALVYDKADSHDPATRHDATLQLARSQRNLASLVETKAAIQTALLSKS